MSQLRCMACAYQGPDVQMTIVELPLEEQRVKEQAYPVSWDPHGRVIGMEYRQVTERFVREPRCRDYNPKDGKPSKCLDRIAAMTTVPLPAGHGEPVDAAPTPADADDPLPAFLR